MKRKKKLKRIKLKSIKSLKNKAWFLVSEYVRRRDESNGCICCRKMIPWKEMHASHFVHRDSLDYNLFNINGSCCACNTYLHGNLGEYAINLNLKYGQGTAESLIAQKHVIHHFTRGELEGIIAALKVKLSELDKPC